MKAKAPPSLVWDNKDKAPPNAVSSWKKYSMKYTRALNDFGGNSTAYDAAVLKGRANPQLAVFLLLYNFLKDQTRVFLCCTRPYLRNVHYASVKEYFVMTSPIGLDGSAVTRSLNERMPVKCLSLSVTYKL